MAESFEDQLSRVEQMATGDPTWDLSDNDIAALQAVLSDRRKLLMITKSAPACACEGTMAGSHEPSCPAFNP